MVLHLESPAGSSLVPLVLVADDDAGIRDLLAMIIRHLGLEALRVGDGAAAVQQVVERGAALCGAFIDLCVPVLDGVATIQAIRQIAPDMQVILMSASFPMALPAQMTALHGARLLHKPFQLREIQALIRSLGPPGGRLGFRCRDEPGRTWLNADGQPVGT